MQVQKRGQTLSRGRHGKNKPRVSQDVLYDVVHNIIKEHKVSFLGHDSPVRNLALYKAFVRLAPALAITWDQPVNLYGFGTFKVVKTSKGKRRLKFKASLGVSDFLDAHFRYRDNRASEVTFEEVLADLLNIGKSKDSSLEEANYGVK